MSTTATTTEALEGSIEQVTFHNPDNGFSVLQLKVRSHRDLVTVVGHLASATAGEFVEASGRRVIDKQHGQQFKADSMRPTHPATPEGMEKYLGSGLIKGIGPVFAEKLVQAFGERVFEVIAERPDRLVEVPGNRGISGERLSVTPFRSAGGTIALSGGTLRRPAHAGGLHRYRPIQLDTRRPTIGHRWHDLHLALTRWAGDQSTLPVVLNSSTSSASSGTVSLRAGWVRVPNVTGQIKSCRGSIKTRTRTRTLAIQMLTTSGNARALRSRTTAHLPPPHGPVAYPPGIDLVGKLRQPSTHPA